MQQANNWQKFFTNESYNRCIVFCFFGQSFSKKLIDCSFTSNKLCLPYLEPCPRVQFHYFDRSSFVCHLTLFYCNSQIIQLNLTDNVILELFRSCFVFVLLVVTPIGICTKRFYHKPLFWIIAFHIVALQLMRMIEISSARYFYTLILVVFKFILGQCCSSFLICWHCFWVRVTEPMKLDGTIKFCHRIYFFWFPNVHLWGIVFSGRQCLIFSSIMWYHQIFIFKNLSSDLKFIRQNIHWYNEKPKCGRLST